MGPARAKFFVLLAAACWVLIGCARAARDVRAVASAESRDPQDARRPGLVIYVADPLHGPLSDLVSAGHRAHPTTAFEVTLESYGGKGGMHWKSWVRAAAAGPWPSTHAVVIVSTDGFTGPDDFPVYVGRQGLSLETGTFRLRARDCTYHFVSRPGTAGSVLDVWRRWLGEPPVR